MSRTQVSTRDDLRQRFRDTSNLGDATPDSLTEKFVDDLLDRRVGGCSAAWAKEMVRRFDLPDDGTLDGRREVIREVQQRVGE